MRAALSLFVLGTCVLGSTCKPLEPGDRQRLAQYVKKKYKLGTANVTLSTVVVIEGGCFRKLQFQSPGRTLPPLYLSPDLRFLTAELMDSRLDPVIEERRRRTELAAQLSSGARPSIGPRNAPVIIALFSDFQCPYCARMAAVLRREVLPAESKSVRLVFRYFPLTGHDWARAAAEATACAAEQGDEYFWKLHDSLFDHQRELKPDSIRTRINDDVSRFRGFDRRRYTACLDTHAASHEIDADLALGARIGVSGTPTLYLNGERASSAPVAEQIRTLIREASAQVAVH